tara:strand:- start:467 stop:808 length:342 start_codon:yes stop_codon:yes gene_type:complete
MLTVSGIVRLTKDPEIKQAGKTTVGKARVAYNSGFGEWKRSHFIDLSVFGKRGEAFAKAFTKGDPVWVTGSLESREHNERTYWSITANEWEFIPKKNDAPKREEENGIEDLPF